MQLFPLEGSTWSFCFTFHTIPLFPQLYPSILTYFVIFHHFLSLTSDPSLSSFSLTLSSYLPLWVMSLLLSLTYLSWPSLFHLSLIPSLPISFCLHLFLHSLYPLPCSLLSQQWSNITNTGLFSQAIQKTKVLECGTCLKGNGNWKSCFQEEKEKKIKQL